MIRIRHRDLEEIADWHYQGFIKSFYSVLQKKRNRCKRKKDKQFIRFLVANLKVLLTGSPGELEKIIEVASNRYRPAYYFHKEWKNRKERNPTSLFNLLNKAFDYEKFCNSKNDDWNAYRLAEKLNVSTCPYCNRQYTHTIIDDTQTKEQKKRIVRPDFDHFYDKASFPFLALSFYNLIPSCSVCNSRFKGSEPFTTKTHIHPYSEEFGSFARFRLSINSSKFFHGDLNSGEIKFQYKEPADTNDEQLIDKARKNIEAFELEKLYQEHKDYAFELVNRSLIYNEDYLDALYKKYDGTLIHSRENFLRIIHGNYFEEGLESNRPLSKLAGDIQLQFDL